MSKRPKVDRVQGTTLKYQLPLPNIHLNKGKYPHSGDADLNGSRISDISHISQVYKDMPIVSIDPFLVRMVTYSLTTS